jgi:secreted trypsin-like serine protease
MKYAVAALLVLLHLGACSEQPSLHGEVNTSEKPNSIVGGQNVKPSDEHIDFTVLIMGKNENGESYSCTGTLVDTDMVLTAAHCLGEKDTMQIAFGENPIQDGPVELMKVKNILKHEKYNHSEEIRNDIALIQLDGVAPDNFPPAVLPWTTPKKSNGLARVQVYGYGITSGLMENGKPNHQGIGVLRTTTLKILRESDKQDIFYANQKNGRGVCSGDSGGPAFINGKVIVGIASRVITDDPAHPEKADKDVCNYESVFTSVNYYKTWILDGIQALH